MLTIESKPFILSIYSERETCWLHVSRTFLGLFKVIRCPYPDSQLTAQRYSSDIYWPVAELFKWFRIAKMWLIPFSIQFDLMIWIRKEKQSKWTNLFVFSSSSSSLLSIGWLDANGESIMQMRPRNIPLPRNTQYLHTMLLLLMLVLRIRDSGGFFSYLFDITDSTRHIECHQHSFFNYFLSNRLSTPINPFSIQQQQQKNA